MNARLDREFAEELERLGPEERARALRYIRSLKPGVPGRSLLRFAGTIPPDDIERIRQAIDEDFERVRDES
jgi:hypothetical protein